MSPVPKHGRGIDMLGNSGNKCAQCGKEGPLRRTRIIGRDRDPYTRKAIVVTREYDVCADGPCGAHLQMAHEG
jgi:hypothetical protein